MPNTSTPTSNSGIRFPRLLLTGAGGNLGQELRPRLKAYCDVLRVSHRRDLGPAAAGEEVQTASLEDAEHMLSLLDGVSAVVHMGGVSTEQPWAPILAGNIVGMVNLYEAARLKGVKRIVFASSNHVTGFYRQDEVVNTRMPPKPDGFYGLSKAFGEDLAQLYWDRWGVETVSIRIGSSFTEPRDRRMLATYLSYDDLERLVVAALTAPIVGHSIIYGMSDNQTTWWDNTHAKHIGYRPQDSSDVFRHAVEARQQTIDKQDPAAIYQGGAFVKATPHG
ncbi:NAD(P)-dependent oxidoreductase [Limnohabitans sp. Rim47]|jgi:uronate dehydrogenase|uniref:NAD-dependent epimerase/dehydratase family protein n=1 Tax=Limnohabitans sp. Rim47 TaxID=1100721 RepID=UPI0002F38D23|nr:NAD(P)-dependent oxidoreductase [Limnohabitans sp. Rim47]